MIWNIEEQITYISLLGNDNNLLPSKRRYDQYRKTLV